MKIKLPKKSNAIDFKFMEDFITEFSANKMKELTKYLKVKGLSDYKLTEKEEKILTKKVKFKEFLLTDIFEMKNTKCIVQEQIKLNSGKIPYVTAASNNNGVMTYIDCPKEWLDEGNSIMIGGKTLTFTYQEKDFCSNDSHNIALYLKEKNYENRETILYLIAALNKSLSKKYSWGYSVSMKKIKEDFFYLPVKNNAPDYDYMETYIKALQKLIIADVQKYADTKIAAATKAATMN
ncbi:MAG: restriction endonuclease subunit S [Selenomonadaceae bacterium]|nr:restriction endonuclease subunit S [Selenomonadaceae bacterium]